MDIKQIAEEVKKLLHTIEETEESAEEVAEVTEVTEVVEEVAEEVEEVKEPEIDYKVLYEEEHKKLLKAQKDNTRKDISGAEDKTSEEILKDFCRSFY